MPRGRKPETVTAKDAARIVGWSVDHFHRTWRTVPAIVAAAYEGNRAGSPTQFVKHKLIAYRAAKKLIGASPIRAVMEEDDEVLEVAGAISTLLRVLSGEPILCDGCLARAQRDASGVEASPALKAVS